jgi:uncharacterized integral membrane protein
MITNIFTEVLKGFVIAIIFFEVTLSNDTTVENIILFVAFYLCMILSAMLAQMDTNVITGAFLTKTVFTLVDERIKRNNKTDNGK